MAIGVDIEALEGAASRVDGISGNFQAELTALSNLVVETGNYMQGGPQAAFEAKFEQFKGTLTNFIGALNTYSQAMKAYAEDQRNTVSMGSKRFDNI